VSFSLLFVLGKDAAGIKQLCPCRGGGELSSSLQVVIVLVVVVAFAEISNLATIDLEGKNLVMTRVFEDNDNAVGPLVDNMLEEGFPF
jgi:hypothetical protein